MLKWKRLKLMKISSGHMRLFIYLDLIMHILKSHIDVLRSHGLCTWIVCKIDSLITLMIL